jgi:asparagine synthase (glutamine-hydrolysing)
MCGICGKLNFNRDAAVSPALVSAMADAIRHRGPDDEGLYVSGNIGLGFRRLSIIDLAGGHQPLSNEDGTVWIVFNGEIYNYRELRAELLSRGHAFKTQSDTEAIVHLYEEFGEACVEKLRGMFAFAIWDSRDKSMFLARDRVGIKPLYYWRSPGSLVFGSEIKAILADPEVKVEVDPAMIDRFLTFDYLPGEQTLFKNIRKLAPGHTLTIREGKCELRRYWDLQFSPIQRIFSQAKEELSGILEESVRLHMISDVPVGFLLSGGVDSTAMLSFAADKSDKEISSYTVGFSGANVADERPYARLAAKAFRSRHFETTITAEDFASFLPQYVWYMEEPVCEPPAVALYYVSKLAREHVKVLISGEGGDEAFAGYPNYRSMVWLERLKQITKPFNGTLASAFSAGARWSGSSRVAKYSPLLGLPQEEYYWGRTSTPFRFFNSKFTDFYSHDLIDLVDKRRSAEPALEHMRAAGETDALSKMLYVDTKTWLPDDLLVKADKMTMANSVELRVPLLDHRVLEFAASLPSKFKVRGLTTKYIAKETLRGRVPREILNRPKAGFPVPYESWLRNGLKSWVNEILLDGRSLSRGYFRKRAVENLLAEDERNGGHSKEVFSLLVLELWHREFLDKPAPASDSPVNPSCLVMA